MKVWCLIFFIAFLVGIPVCAQDTIYLDANGTKVKSISLASSKRVVIKDSLNRKKTTEKTYYLSGQLKSEVEYFTGYKKDADKSLIEMYERGQLDNAPVILGKILDKKEDGRHREWTEKGNLRLDVQYKGGKYDGLLLTYWENGQVRRNELFEQGKSLGGKRYSSEGKELDYCPYEIMPVFPGGEEELMSFIRSKLKYPRSAFEEKIQGKVITRFVVNKFGEISKTSVIRGVNQDLDNEALRVLSLMPKWTPGQQEGVPVDVYFVLPFSFKFQ